MMLDCCDGWCFVVSPEQWDDGIVIGMTSVRNWFHVAVLVRGKQRKEQEKVTGQAIIGIPRLDTAFVAEKWSNFNRNKVLKCFKQAQIGVLTEDKFTT
jgi:hypothetical protein